MSNNPKWEEKYIPDMLGTWTNVGSSPVVYGYVLKIAGTLYIFGGSVSASGHAETTKIYSTAWTNPTGWTDTGVSVSGFSAGSPVGIVNNTIYSWGTVSKTTIWSAPISTPLVWSSTGVTMASPRNSVPLVITPTHVSLAGGYNGSTGNGNVAYATVANPTSFSTGGSVAGWERSGCYLDGEEIFSFGGAFNQASFVSTNPRAPGTVQLSTTTNYAMGNLPAVFHVGNRVWLLSQNTNTITHNSDKAMELADWSISGAVLPGIVQYVFGSYWVGPDGYAYVIEAADANGYIYRSPRKKIYVIDPAIPGIYSHRRAVDATTGEPTNYTIQCQMGMAPWFTNRRDVF